jgi:tetratricopeptide (TPR) repeat protein
MRSRARARDEVIVHAVSDWAGHEQREIARYEDGEARLPEAADPDARQKQLTRMGNAAAGAGLALLMQGRQKDAAGWLNRAAERYGESLAEAPPGSWGRSIGAMKALLLAGDRLGAEKAARVALELGAAEAESPIGRYTACLALLLLGRDEEARPLAGSLRDREDFPHDVADALATLAAADRLGYTYAVESVLESFETREEYLEDVPVADTVMVLQELAARRDVAAELSSPLLP